MADPDSLIQKVQQKITLFDLGVAIPNMKKEYKIMRSDADKIVFRKIWENASLEEKEKIESDMNYELEYSRSRERSRSRSSSRSSSSWYTSDSSDSD